jgi:Helix-turn-helix domain
VAIGGALAAARSEAGMTVTQVSDRTRIRATIIRDIERDDYSSCGGDFYARGHIRAIARVVGADPVPLIQEYDTARLPPPEPESTGPATDSWSLARLSGSLHGPDAARNGASRPDPIVGGITAAEAFRPSMPLEARRRRPGRAGSLALALLAVIGLLIYLLVSGSPGHGTAAPGRQHASTVPRPAGRQHAKPAPKRSTPALALVPLTPASATAFGPDGTGQGDNPSLAPLAVDASSSTSWQTDWYSTAQFSGLQRGTGLLLDMGADVRISTVRLLLGAAAGGAFQLRAGDTPQLASLLPVSQSADTGGSVTVPVAHPVSARYLLIWFTSLPPDNAGTYQASLYDVSVTGSA